MAEQQIPSWLIKLLRGLKDSLGRHPTTAEMYRERQALRIKAGLVDWDNPIDAAKARRIHGPDYSPEDETRRLLADDFDEEFDYDITRVGDKRFLRDLFGTDPSAADIRAGASRYSRSADANIKQFEANEELAASNLLDVPSVPPAGTRMPATTTSEGAVIQPPIRGGAPTTEHVAAIVTPGKKPTIVQATSHMEARMAARDAGLMKDIEVPGVIEGFVREGKLVDDLGIPVTRARPGRTGYSVEDIAEQKKTISTLSRLLEGSPQVRGAIGPEGRLWSGGPWWAAGMGAITAADVVRRINEDPLTRIDEEVQVQVGRPDGDAHDNVYAGIAADVVRSNDIRDLDVGTPSQQHTMERVLNLREPEPFDLPEVSMEDIAVKPDVTATPSDYKRLQEHLAARTQPEMRADTGENIPVPGTTARGEAMAEFVRETPINALLAGAYEGTGYAATMLNGLIFGIPYLMADDEGKAAIREKVGASPITRYANQALDVMNEARATGDIGIPHEVAMLGGDVLAGFGLTKMGANIGSKVGAKARVSSMRPEVGPASTYTPPRPSGYELPEGVPDVLGGTTEGIAARRAADRAEAPKELMDYMVGQGAPQDITMDLFNKYSRELDPYVGTMAEGEIFTAFTRAKGGNIATTTGRYDAARKAIDIDVMSAGSQIGDPNAAGVLGITGTRRVGKALAEAYPDARTIGGKHLAGSSPGRTRKKELPESGKKR